MAAGAFCALFWRWASGASGKWPATITTAPGRRWRPAKYCRCAPSSNGSNANIPGQVIDVELEREHENSQERWVYKIKLLRSGGSLIKLKVDARDRKHHWQEGTQAGEHEREQQRNRRGGEGTDAHPDC
jgi:hypothetical protein